MSTTTAVSLFCFDPALDAVGAFDPNIDGSTRLGHEPCSVCGKPAALDADDPARALRPIRHVACHARAA